MDIAPSKTAAMLRICQAGEITPICPGTCSAPRKVFYNRVRYVRGKDGRYRSRYLSPESRPQYLHRQIWLDARYRPFDDPVRIPDGHEIHHRDFNRFNNYSGNLVAMPQKEHRALHRLAQLQGSEPVLPPGNLCPSCPIGCTSLDRRRDR